MTLMLASVTGPEEAEIAISGGADIIDLKDPAAGPLGSLSPVAIHAAVGKINGRRAVSAVAGVVSGTMHAANHAGVVAETGVDYVKIGLAAGGDRNAVIRALAGIAGRTKLVAVLFADKEKDCSALVPAIAEAGFAGVMLDTANKAGGRLLQHGDIAMLQKFVEAAHVRGLLAGLAGALEAPDVPRLLPLRPDFLGFRGALCEGDRRAKLSLAKVKAIRKLIPTGGETDQREGADKKDLAHRRSAERIFVRDFVLPVRIGAYGHERGAPQKVRFDVTVELAPRDRAARGMADVVSYDLITDGIKAIVAEGHVELAEELAERIAARVLEERRVTRVTVRIEKLELGPGGIGVEIVMEREA